MNLWSLAFVVLSLGVVPSCQRGEATDNDELEQTGTTLGQGIDFTGIVSTKLSDSTREVSLRRVAGESWVLERPEKEIRAHFPALRSIFIIMHNLALGPEVSVTEDNLGELGLAKGSENYVSLTLTESDGVDYQFSFGDYNQPFDRSDAQMLGEAFTARRYVRNHQSGKVHLVDYPFHEVTANYHNWYVHNFEVLPRRVKGFHLKRHDGQVETFTRTKPFAAFKDHRGQELPAASQKALDSFLEEGFFPKVISSEEEQLLQEPLCHLQFEDFAGHTFKLAIGGAKHINRPEDNQDFQPGMITIESTGPDSFACRAVRYTTKTPSGETYEMEVFLEADLFQPFSL